MRYTPRRRMAAGLAIRDSRRGGVAVEQQFSLGSRRDRATLRVSVAGRLDRSTVHKLEKALDDTWDVPTDRVVLDLSKVSYLDGAALRTLFRAKKQAREGHLSMAIVRPRGYLGRIFTLTRVGEVLSVVERPDQVHGA